MREKQQGDSTMIVALLLILMVAIIGGIVWAATPVKFGTVRVVKQFGGLTGQVFTEGLNWKIPLVQTTEKYVTAVQSYETSNQPDNSEANYTDFTVTANTSDGQEVKISYTILFRISPETVIDMARNIGDEDAVVENVVKAHSRSITRLMAQAYSAEALFGGEEFTSTNADGETVTGRRSILDYQEDVRQELSERFKASDVVLVDVLIRKVSFDEDYVNAIELQQIAQEKIETAQYEADAAVFEKEAAIQIAQGDAERIKLEASAQAEAQRELADAEAYSIGVRGETLAQYPGLTQWEFVQVLPSVNWMILPDNGVTPLLPVPEIDSEAVVEGAQE